MNSPLLAIPLSASIPRGVKKKRGLLIGAAHAKRDLRAEVLRKLGMIDCAADIAEARSGWRPALYGLALLNLDGGRGQRDMFCDDLRSATPPQRLAFLVGQPEYLADSANANEELAAENENEQAPSAEQTPLLLLFRGMRLSGGASGKLRGESRQSAPRALLAGQRCAPCLLRLEILKGVQRKQRRPRPAETIY